jgi:hypothetical protein
MRVKPRKNMVRVILTLVILVAVVTTVGFLFVKGMDKSYISKSDRFKITFPYTQQPEVMNESMPFESYDLSVKVYRSAIIDYDGQLTSMYAVAIMNYPASMLNDAGMNKLSVEELFARNLAPGLENVDIQFKVDEFFLGYPSASCEIYLSDEDDTPTIYMKMVVAEGYKAYAIMTAGETKEEFDKFLASFKFL